MIAPKKQAAVFTVSQVARMIERTPLRVRQICAKFSLGEKISARLWLLSAEEAEAVRRYVSTAKRGRRKKTKKTIDSRY